MNLLQHHKAAEEALASVYSGGGPVGMTLAIDEAIRHLTLMSQNIRDTFPEQINTLRSEQGRRDDLQS